MKKLLNLLTFVFLISSAYALGCCFDSGTGTCSPQSESSTCTGEGAEFSNDATCSSVSECDYGCCAIATTTSYTREVTCYRQAQAAGVEYTWAAGSEASCSAASTSGDTGACIIGGRYDRICTYTTGATCNNGQFYPGLYCSNPSLNTSCVRTDKTTCYQENVNYLDSCGNIDAKKQTCDYASGSICEKKSSTEASCKDLNCGDYGKSNGDRWCVDTTGAGNVFAEAAAEPATGQATFSKFTGEVIKNGVKGKISPSGLFLRDKLGFNVITGAATTQSCSWSSTNQEYCILPCTTNPNNPHAGYKCTNPDNYCYGSDNTCGGKYPPVSGPAGTGTTSTEGLTPNCARNQNTTSANLTGAAMCDASLDTCGDNLCERCWNDMHVGEGGPKCTPGSTESDCSKTRLDGCVSDNACGSGGGELSVGSRFYSQYCLNGEVYTEPCDDYRMSYCSEETSGSCEVNQGASCYGAKKDECDSDFCVWYDPRGNETLAKEFNLSLCMPKIAPGTELTSAIGTAATSTDNICSLGNLGPIKVKFDHDFDNCNRWYIVTASTGTTFGYAGIFDLDKADWEKFDHCNRGYLFYPECNNLNQLWDLVDEGTNDNAEADNGPELAKWIANKSQLMLLPDPRLLTLLEERCQALGDCVGKTNWIGADSSASNLGKMACVSTRGDQVTCGFEFTCKPWKAPSGSESCEMCGSDGLPCSEYRCKSLGKGCEYKEPAGADKGYCLSSLDNTGPTITASTNPSSPIPPYTSVGVTINTNEDSQCAFNIGNAGSNFEGMEYSIDDAWGKQHKVILNVPGRRTSLEENDTSAYSLITHDGVYNMYVRCEDPFGNFNPVAKLVRFEVMDTPDKVPPVIMNITPSSGSALLFNTTQKSISLKLNEPADCRWSQEDKDYSLMEEQFTCDTTASDSGLLNGYFCSGSLTNVTLNTSLQTRYFIRCKDQPYLEGHEDQYYTRNANPTSKEYLLRPSSELKISTILPTGIVTVGSGITNITLTATTEGGSESGKAQCSWRFIYNNVTTAYQKFTNTNSRTHSAVLTNKTEGNYDIQVKCSDSADNEVTKTSPLGIRYDHQSPIISRVYNDRGLLKLRTSEPATCKFINAIDTAACLISFNSQNATLMYGNSSIEHTTTWKKGFTYLIRCKDFYNNDNSGCGLVAKALR